MERQVNKIKFYTQNAKNVPECFGYPYEMVNNIMKKFVDICIEYERECIMAEGKFSKPVYITRVMDWLYGSTELDPAIDVEDRNFQFLVDLILNDVMYKFEMTGIWEEASLEEKAVLNKYFGHMYGYYAHKKQIMVNNLPDEEE